MRRAFAEAMASIPPPPCDACLLATRCRAQGLACLEFYAYVINRPAPNVQRKPTRAVHNRIYGKHCDI